MTKNQRPNLKEQKYRLKIKDECPVNIFEVEAGKLFMVAYLNAGEAREYDHRRYYQE
jgi:hypothetical protein